jgi:hypothetical protein
MNNTFRRVLAPALLLCLLTSCGPTTAKPQVAVAPPAALSEQKMRWILELEDQRVLRGGGGDLVTLLTDSEPRIRRHRLAQKHGFGVVNYYRKESFSLPAAPALVREIAAANDVVITAIGD